MQLDLGVDQKLLGALIRLHKYKLVTNVKRKMHSGESDLFWGSRATSRGEQTTR